MKYHHRLCLLAGVILALATPVQAEITHIDLSGYLMGFEYLDMTQALNEKNFFAEDHPEHDWFYQDRSGLRLQLRLASDPTQDIFFDSSVNFEYDARRASRQPNADISDGMSVFFKEGFISIKNALDVFDVKIGRQYIFWGRFEWGGALDLFSPWDFSSMSAEKENYRMPVDAIRLYTNFDPLTIETVLVPVPEFNRMDYDLPDQLGPLTVFENPAKIPSRSWSNAEIGVRPTLPLGDFGEASLTYFHGYDRTFSMYVDIKNDSGGYFPDGLLFTPAYNRLDVFGGDAEWYIGGLTFMAESAFYQTPDDAGTDIFVKNHRIRNTIGTEFDLTANISIQCLYGNTYVLDYDRQAEYDARKSLGEPHPYVERTSQNTIFYRIRYLSQQGFGVQFMNLLNLEDTNFMILSFISWDIGTDLKLYSGVVMFRGPEGTRFGRLEEEGRFFSELKYSF
jgi:hypothetical protein